MYIVWYAAAIVTGLGLGLCFGMLLRAVLTYWESAATASKIFMGVMLALFGGGAFGATALFARLTEADNAAFYLLGLGSGLILGTIGLFFPERPYTLKRVRNIVEMSEAMRDKVPDIEDRVSLIAAQLMPPRAIEREAQISEEELAKRLERAADALAAAEENEAGDAGGGS